MIFKGISRDFDLTDEQQYETIGCFWDELALIYGVENLRGLGYSWKGNILSYAIGLKNGDIEGCNFLIELPDTGWVSVNGKTDNLKELYDEIYKSGSLKYEIETFNENGECQIKYYR